MDNGAQAAETITRVVIMGSTFILGLGGKVALSVARFAAAAMDPNAKQSGKVRLKALLQSGSELKVFTLQGEANYQRFAAEAKNYGILYSVVKRTDEDVQGEVYDLLVRAEDASKINLERMLPVSNSEEKKSAEEQLVQIKASIKKMHKNLRSEKGILRRMGEMDAKEKKLERVRSGLSIGNPYRRNRNRQIVTGQERSNQYG